MNCWILLLCAGMANIYVCGENIRAKRELSIENANLIANIQKDIKDLAENLRKNKSCTKREGGGTYTRWGRSDCPGGSKLIYAGQAGGGHYADKGAPVNLLCLPRAASYKTVDAKENNGAVLYAAQYHYYRDYKNDGNRGTIFDYYKYNQKGVPCAVCLTTNRPAIVMIPAKHQCFSGMTREYSGYLMAGHKHHNAGSEYICVDGKAETISTSNPSWHTLINPVEMYCDGGLNCKSYKTGYEVTCVVCSK